MKKDKLRREKVANLLQSVRLQKGLSVKDVADRMGCSTSTVERIEKGVFSPSSDVLYVFCDALGISIKINNEDV